MINIHILYCYFYIIIFKFQEAQSIFDCSQWKEMPVSEEEKDEKLSTVGNSVDQGGKS
jgi:hypothetical protein